MSGEQQLATVNHIIVIDDGELYYVVRGASFLLID
jgi:hypothetical protein